MAYEYTPKPLTWLSAAAKFAYFRNAEATIDVGQLIAEMTGPKCGTRAGHAAHFTAKTKPCQPCREVHNAYMRGRRLAKKIQMRSSCGTYAGYMRHMRDEGLACRLCLDAYARYMADYRARKKVA